MGMAKSFVNAVVNLVMGLAKMFDLKWKISVDEHKIYMEVVEPDKKRKRSYNRKHYVNGNIYLRGKANPIKPILDKAEQKVKLISSKRYQNVISSKILRMIQTEETSGWTAKKVALIVLILTTFNTIIIGLGAYFILGGGF